MKKFTLLMFCALLLGACSSPKYAYYFDYYDYNSGKKKSEALTSRHQIASPETSPLAIDQQALVASAEKRIVPIEQARVAPAEQVAFAKKYSAMSKREKKEFRKEIKSDLKKFIKAKKEGKDITSVNDTKAMDHDLKMAIIFGAVAVTLSFFGGVNSVFWVLSVVSLVIAVVFFIKWLAEQ